MKSINKTMIESAIKLAREVKAGYVLLCVDVRSELADLSEDERKSVRFVLVMKESEELPEKLLPAAKKLDIPDVNLTRVGKIKISIAKGIVSGLFKKRGQDRLPVGCAEIRLRRQHLPDRCGSGI